MKSFTQALLISISCAACLVARAGTTVFTYQGQLTDNSAPANGNYDFQFTLYDAGTNGNAIGSPVTNSLVATNGFFVATLDFGSTVFDGSDLWLNIGVRTNGAVNFIGLASRQRITAVPYAITASNLTGVVSASQINGALVNGNLPASPTFSGTITASAFSGGGANITALDANNLLSGTVPNARLNANVALLNTSAQSPQSFLGPAIGLGGPAPSSGVNLYNPFQHAALQTTTAGIILGDVAGNSYADYLSIDFEGTPGFTFHGGDVSMDRKLSVTGGNVEIPGNNDFKYTSAKTHYCSVSAFAFEVEGTTYARGAIAGDIYLATGSAVSVGYLEAPVQLPDGAIVTSVTFYVVDNDGTYNLQPGQLWRTDASTATSYGNTTQMANVPIPASSNSTLIQACTTSSITVPVIDNQNYSYYLRWGTQQANSNMRLIRVLITYTVTKAD
jgi:hypothetical protein